MNLPRGATALQHRNFRLFWSGQLVSLIGTWMQTVGQSWLVLILTNNAFTLGIIAVAQFLPVLVFGLFGGVIADVVPKRKTLIGTQIASMILAFALAAISWLGIAEVWHIVVLALLLGCTNALDIPVRQAFTVEMVGRKDVANGIALNSAIFTMARIAGPAIAGLVIGLASSAAGSQLAGVAICFGLNGMSYVAVLAGLVSMRDEELFAVPHVERPPSFRGVLASLGEGLRYARRTRVVLLAIVVTGLVSFAGLNLQVLIPVYAKANLGVDATGLGFLLAASGIGSLIAAIGIAISGRARMEVLVGGVILLGVLECGLFFATSMAPALILLFGIGIGGIALTATANTAIQLIVPDELRGRVISIYATVFVGATPFGGPAFGWLASTKGAPFALFVGGAISLATGIGAGVLVLRGWGRGDERPRLAPASGAGVTAAAWSGTDEPGLGSPRALRRSAETEARLTAGPAAVETDERTGAGTRR